MLTPSARCCLRARDWSICACAFNFLTKQAAIMPKSPSLSLCSSRRRNLSLQSKVSLPSALPPGMYRQNTLLSGCTRLQTEHVAVSMHTFRQYKLLSQCTHLDSTSCCLDADTKPRQWSNCDIDLPPGIRNGGNICYAISVLQCRSEMYVPFMRNNRAQTAFHAV